MEDLSKKLRNLDGFGLFFAFICASCGIGLVWWRLLLSSSPVTLVLLSIPFAVGNFVVLFYKSPGGMRGSFSAPAKIALCVVAVGLAPLVSLSLIIYIFGLMPALEGNRNGHIVFFVLSPAIFAAWGLTWIASGASGFHLLDKWHPATCSVCGKDMQINAMVKSPVCSECLPKLEDAVDHVDGGIRLLNLLLDYVAVYALVSILALLFTGDVPQALRIAAPLTFAISLVNWLAFETLWGKTIAKFITGTKVVTLTGEKPEFRTIFIRTLCRLIPFEALSFVGYPVGWHDSISKTRVVEG